ncbi:MAG: hypothetical protein ABIM64_05530 [candidate division WOR-3 bacterium]
MEKSWIKLYRKLLDDPIFANEKGLKIWIWCLLKAAHKKKEILVGRQKIMINKGEFIFGSIAAKEELKMPIATIWFWLNFLERNENVETKRTNKFSIIKIKNWEKYQEVENRWKTDGKQMETNKNVKNINNNNINNINNNINNNNNKLLKLLPSTSETSSQWDFEKKLREMESSKRRDIRIISLYWRFKGFVFDNQEKFCRAIKRELRPAGNLIGYSDEEIIRTMEWLHDNTSIKFTLETVHKFIDENLNNLNPIQR